MSPIQAEHLRSRLSIRGSILPKLSRTDFNSQPSFILQHQNQKTVTQKIMRAEKPQQQQQVQNLSPLSNSPPELEIITCNKQLNQENTVKELEDLPKKCVLCQKKKPLLSKSTNIFRRSSVLTNQHKNTNRTVGGNTDDDDDVNDEDIEEESDQQFEPDSKGIRQNTQFEDDIDQNEISKQKEEIQGYDQITLARNQILKHPPSNPSKPIPICRCDHWNHAHPRCLISRTIYNTFKCKNCKTITQFKTRRNYSFSILWANFQQRKPEVIGIFRLFGITSASFLGYLIYFLYTLFIDGKNIEFFIRICCLLCFIMLFIYGLAFFMNKIEKLCVVEIASDLAFSDLFPDDQNNPHAKNNNKQQLNHPNEDKESLDKFNDDTQVQQSMQQNTIGNQFELTSPGNITPTIFSPTQSMHHSFSQQSLIQMNRPIQGQNTRTWAESHLLGNNKSNFILPEERPTSIQMTTIPLQPGQKTPKRSVTVNEESPEYKIHVAGQSKSRPTGSCLKNGSSFHSTSSGSSGVHPKKQILNFITQKARPSIETSDATREKSHSFDDCKNSIAFRPFESTGNNTCRFGTGSLVLQGSNASLNPILPSSQPNIEMNRGILPTNIGHHHSNRRLYLQKAFMNVGTFFTPIHKINSKADTDSLSKRSNENQTSSNSPHENNEILDNN